MFCCEVRVTGYNAKLAIQAVSKCTIEQEVANNS